MVALRDEIVRFLDEYLDVQGIRDYGPMGMQVIGKAEVERVALAVSASRACFAQAAAQQADMLIVHHGLLWDNESRVIGKVMRDRLELLFRHDMSLLGYHLCLDKHPEIGNNVLALRALGATPIEFDAPLGGVGYVGEFSEPVAWAELTERVRSTFGGEPYLFPHGPPRTSRLGLVTGGAGHASNMSWKRRNASVIVTSPGTSASPHRQWLLSSASTSSAPVTTTPKGSASRLSAACWKRNLE